MAAFLKLETSFLPVNFAHAGLVAAIITPPDISAQIIVTIPIVLLYELSINIARVVTRNRTKMLNDRLAQNGGVS